MVSWRMAEEWPDASYACVNLRETYAPDEIRHAVCVRGDIGETLRQLKTLKKPSTVAVHLIAAKKQVLRALQKAVTTLGCGPL